jgi:hypothetical protein
MARFSAFLGRRVEVQYRAGDLLLPASAMFVADSGRSIFLEQNSEQRGRHRHFRWEIPYQYVIRIEEKPNSGASEDQASSALVHTSAPDPSPIPKADDKSIGAPARASEDGAPGLLPLSCRPRTA